jgi:hypothetical protein
MTAAFLFKIRSERSLGMSEELRLSFPIVFRALDQSRSTASE